MHHYSVTECLEVAVACSDNGIAGRRRHRRRRLRRPALSRPLVTRAECLISCMRIASLLLLSLGWASTASGFQDYPRVPGDALVKVIMLNELGRPIEQGTGVLISPDGWVLTVAHAVTFNPELTRVEQNGALHAATAVYLSNRHCFDLALVRFEAHDLPYLELAAGSPRVSETVFSIGYPRGAYKWSSGFVLRYLDGDMQTGLAMTSFVSDRGASGSPLINLRREVCGVLTMAGFDHNNQPVSNFWVPASQIQQLIGEARETGKWPHPPQSPSVPPRATPVVAPAATPKSQPAARSTTPETVPVPD